MPVVNLYINHDDVRTLNKTLTGQMSYSAEFYDDCSIASPKIKLSWNNNIPNYNYMFIPEFRRYYFITSVAVTGGAALITGEVDPLMSFINEIQDLSAICIRDSRLNQKGSSRSSWIDDPKLPIINGRNVKIVEFEGSDFNIYDEITINDANFVLNVAGGGIVT